MHLQKCFGVVLGLGLLACPLKAVSVSTELSSPSVRSLRASRLASNLQSRGIGGCLDHDLELHYVDESTHETSAQFTAQVQMRSKLPALVLEEIEHHVDEIACFDSSILLQFSDMSSLHEMYEELAQQEEFFLITSHDGCNNDGERMAYRVFDMFVDEGDQDLILSTERSPWEDTVHSVTVHFGPNSDNYELRQHRNLQPRQAATSSAAVSSELASFTQSVSATTSIDFPSPTSMSGMPTQTNIAFNNRWIDQQIWPMVWDTSVGNVSLSGPAIPSGFNLKCKECSITGSIDLVSGSFNATATNSATNGLEQFEYFLEYGFVELRSDHFAAHVELETTILPSLNLISYHVNLPSINFLGFEIPGVATVGPLLVPQLRMGLKLATELDFTYGFDVKVPDDSVIRIDLLNVTKSFVSGFSDSSVTALPFQAQVSGLDLVLSTSFSPELLLGLSLFEFDTNIGAGARFDLPSITAVVTQLEGVDANCQPPSSSAASPDTVSDTDLIGNWTHIVPSVDFGLDLIAFVDVDEVGIDLNDVYQALQADLPLPTACLRFDSDAKTYGPATATATATATGSSATASNAAIASRGRALGLWRYFGGCWGVVGTVLMTSAL